MTEPTESTNLPPSSGEQEAETTADQASSPPQAHHDPEPPTGDTAQIATPTEPKKPENGANADDNPKPPSSSGGKTTEAPSTQETPAPLPENGHGGHDLDPQRTEAPAPSANTNGTKPNESDAVGAVPDAEVKPRQDEETIADQVQEVVAKKEKANAKKKKKKETRAKGSPETAPSDEQEKTELKDPAVLENEQDSKNHEKEQDPKNKKTKKPKRKNKRFEKKPQAPRTDKVIVYHNKMQSALHQINKALANTDVHGVSIVGESQGVTTVIKITEQLKKQEYITVTKIETNLAFKSRPGYKKNRHQHKGDYFDDRVPRIEIHVQRASDYEKAVAKQKALIAEERDIQKEIELGRAKMQQKLHRDMNALRASLKKKNQKEKS